VSGGVDRPHEGLVCGKSTGLTRVVAGHAVHGRASRHVVSAGATLSSWVLDHEGGRSVPASELSSPSCRLPKSDQCLRPVSAFDRRGSGRGVVGARAHPHGAAARQGAPAEGRVLLQPRGRHVQLAPQGVWSLSSTLFARYFTCAQRIHQTPTVGHNPRARKV